MSANRKKKLQEREKRQQKLRSRHRSTRVLSPNEVNFRAEIEHIVGCAAEHDARIVSLGPLVFFSTETGDAWILDSEDKLAHCLARGGDPQPVRIVETESSFGLEWSRTFTIDSERFTTTDRVSGQVATVLGYPTQHILAAINRAGG